jgi:hypothetical protein
MRKAFVRCPELFKRQFVDNLRLAEQNSVDLHFGACFARGMEFARKYFYVRGWTPEDSFEMGVGGMEEMWGNFQAPTGSNKTLPRLIGALRYYFERWPLENEELTPVEGGIECSFAIDLPILHPETGLPLQYAGRFDMLATDSNGRYYIVDEKTTGRLGDSWYLQWDMDSQMTGYIWAVKNWPTMYLEPDVEVMAQVRGVSILKNDYGHAEVNVVRSQHMIDEWYEQLLHDVQHMIVCWKSKWWDQSFSQACTDYGRVCEYAMLCKSADAERLIEGNYKEVIWNPLGHELCFLKINEKVAG